MINRVGDWGLAVGIFLLFLFAGTVDFLTIFALLPGLGQINLDCMGYCFSLMDVLAFFLFFGVVGKSAQFGLHT